VTEAVERILPEEGERSKSFVDRRSSFVSRSSIVVRQSLVARRSSVTVY
jgi:hypothetical protein